MALIAGPVTPAGAVIEVRVGPGPARRALLLKHAFPVPAPVPVRAIIDTGASMSGFAERVFRVVDLTSVRTTAVLTPSTTVDRPFVTDLYDVSIYLVADGEAHEIIGTEVMAAVGWEPAADGGAEGIIGRDVLDHTVFTYHGPGKTFSLGF